MVKEHIFKGVATALVTPMNRDGVDMYPICFANDYVGYVVPDNDFAFMAHEPDELLSTGKYAASTIIQAFQSLMEQIEKA